MSLDTTTPRQPAPPGAGEPQLVERRKARIDRRGQSTHPDASENDTPSGFDRRRGPGRRRTDYRRAAEEGEMTEEQLAFIMAMDEYKRANNKPYPTLTEILDVMLYLGYRKVAEPGEFKLTKPRQTPIRPRPAPKTPNNPEPAEALASAD